MLRQAKARGARFTISTDAHHPKHLLNMRYGVTMARRAWLGPEDILNTLSLEGARVSYEATQGQKGMQADNVSAI